MENTLTAIFKPTKKKVLATVFFAIFLGITFVIRILMNLIYFRFYQPPAIRLENFGQGTPSLGFIFYFITFIVNLALFFFGTFILTGIFRGLSFVRSNLKPVVIFSILTWLIINANFNFLHFLSTLFPRFFIGGTLTSISLIFFIVLVLVYIFVCLFSYFQTHLTWNKN